MQQQEQSSRSHVQALFSDPIILNRKKSTCLKSRLHDVRRDAHDPVEDAGQSAGEDGLADAEVRPGAALRDQRALDDLVAPEVCGTGRNV